MVVCQDRGRLVFSEAMCERFQWGWVYGTKRATMVGRPTRAALIILSPAIPLIRLARLAQKALTTPRLRGRFIAALPYLLPLTLAWSGGELYGYLRPRVNALWPAVSTHSQHKEKIREESAHNPGRW